MGTLDQRTRWLVHPVFLAAVGLLVLNDHVLKSRFPGWWTGKLSDVAGLAVVAVLFAVLVGPRRGITVTAVAFAALKLVPGVAERAAPVLGGITRRDASDLLALVVLVPVSHVLRSTPAIAVVRSACSQWSKVVAAAAPIAGAVLAVGATTATSCAPSPAVTLVTAEGPTLYALVEHAHASEWASSTDGGTSWQGSDPPSDAPPTPTTERSEDPGPSEGCVDGSCWRLRDRRVIERNDGDGDAVEELRLTDAEFFDISTGCSGGSIGVLGSIAATTSADGDPVVVASSGADGVLVRQPDASWVQVRVLSAPPVDASRAESVAARSLLLFGPVLALFVWAVGRRRWPAWRDGVATALVGWVAGLMVAGAITFLSGSDTDPVRIVGRIAVPCIVLTTAAALVRVRRPPSPAPPRVPSDPDWGDTGPERPQVRR